MSGQLTDEQVADGLKSAEHFQYGTPSFMPGPAMARLALAIQAKLEQAEAELTRLKGQG